MSRDIYALLVGIDEYPDPRHNLRGCVNDVNAVKEYLEGRVETEKQEQLHIKMLTNQDATRQAVLDGWREHLGQASKDDVVLFYYSGHGSQEQAPPEFWHLEPDRLNETLVCYDSRTEGGWDLADKEFAKLIAEVAEKDPHIAVVLDCCHSGSGTRGEELETRVRRLYADYRRRPLEEYIFSTEELSKLSASRGTSEKTSEWMNLPQGRHVVLSACLDSEEAKEYYGDGQHRGAFSYFLMQALKQANGSLTYRDLFKRANALVRSKVAAQSPQIETIPSKSDDLELPFLGGAIAPAPNYFTVSYNNQHGWVIDGGAIHGIPQSAGSETTTLAVFPFDAPAEQMHNLSEAQGRIEVQSVLPQLSKIAWIDMPAPDSDTTFKAVISNLPLPPLTVSLEGDEAGVQFIRTALTQETPDSNPSLYIQEIAADAMPRLRVVARHDEYCITRPGDDRPLVAQVRGYTTNSAYMLAQQLERIARWTSIEELTAPARGRVPANAVEMLLYRSVEKEYDRNNPPRGPVPTTEERCELSTELRLEYTFKDDEWKRPAFKVQIRNTSNKPLYCALLHLSQMYGVDAGLIPGGGVWLQPGDDTWTWRREPIYAHVPDEMAEQGVTENRDILKLIVSTAEFDATLMEQPELGQLRPAHRGTLEGGRKSVLNRLMLRSQNRAFSRHSEKEESSDDWVTNQISVVTIRPQETAPVPHEGRGVLLASTVTLLPHSELKAQARLSSAPAASRGAGHVLLPPLLKQEPDSTRPLQFTASRGSDPGLSVLELRDIENYEAVTPEQPLQIQVDFPLADEEQVIPVGYDGEFFLPLGEASAQDGKTLIELERLPAPVAQGSRDLKGASRLFFQKIITRKLGLEFKYPLLAAAEIAEDGSVKYEEEAEEIKKRVAQAERILLFTHSLLGDTRDMLLDTRSLHERYDLVLTFDYENLQTPIGETARALKTRLERVGLGVGHGKTLQLVAHGIGGLIARCFIEREEGKEMVSHVLLLGTPNGGSPWPTVKSWVTPLLGLGLNSLVSMIWPAKIIGKFLGTDKKKPGVLSRALQGADTTFKQIQPGSELLKSLEAAPDPGIPYTIIAGNTSVAPGVADTDREDGSSRLSRLLKTLGHKGTALAFLQQPNDMFSSVYSIKNIADDRSPQVEIVEAACDYFSYFSSDAGLEALSKALAKES